MVKVVLIGNGNVGCYLYNTFKETKGIKVIEWYSRNQTKFKDSNVKISNSIEELPDADLYIIAVNDSSIIEIVNRLKINTGLVVHTSGAVNMNILDSFKNYGIFYPLQSISKKHKNTNKSFPYLLEANNKKNQYLLEKIVKKIKSNFYCLNSIQRANIHLAAVFVNNFTNHLFAIGQRLCNENNLPFEILMPLIIETTEKIKTLSPKEAQTGPAKREDEITLDKHLDILKDPILKKIYLTLTDSIIKLNEKEKL